jgi:hypothetical protein
MRNVTTWLAVVLALVILVPVAAGQGRRPDRPTVSKKIPPRPRGVQIDPDNDVILKAIREQVGPTEEQMAQIVRLYTNLRRKQLELARETVRELRRYRQARANEIRLDPSGKGEKDEEETAEAKRTRRAAERTAYAERLAAKMKPLHEKFLVDCRALLDESQHEAWDKCAAQLDLNKGGTRSTREELRWFEPERGPAVGEAAPDFELMDLEGKTVALSDLRGKPVVLRFGSYTSPAFRQKAPRFEELKKAYGDDVYWLIVYTFEAHASDGNWVSFRNKQAGIEIPQHETYEDRVECASMAREKLALTGRVLIDDFDDGVAHLYSGHPNRAYVIDADGKIVSKQIRSSVERTKAALDALLGASEDAGAAASGAATSKPAGGAAGAPPGSAGSSDQR